MILRDPVHGLVSFEGDAERVTTALLATREVQRLRRIRQLGLTSLVFPGAEHSRFSHAIGTAHVMSRLQARLRVAEAILPPDMRLDAESARDAFAAAMLHDAGHGPFSHLFEEVLPNAKHHESWSAEIVRDPGTDVHKALRAMDPGMPSRVLSLLNGTHRLGYLGRAISGLIDVDRADYLLRDSHMTGVRYGLYDLEWLLEALCFAEVPSGEWALAIEGRKGLPPIEGFFLGRHFMYRQVYHHKATRAAECLIRGIFVRMAELVREGAAPNPIPRALQVASLGDALSLSDYLDLDDVQLMYCVESWAKGSDALLSQLCSQLLARALPKTVPLTEGEGAVSEIKARVEELARRRGLRPDLSVWLDHTSDVPYPEPANDGPNGLWVSIRHQSIQRLGDASFLLGELRNKRIETSRLVFAPELRDDVHSILDASRVE